MAHASHGGGCSHTHDEEKDTCEDQWSIYRYVDLDKATCLNESETNSIRNVLRPWHLRYDTGLPVLTSAVDEQLLLYIPFTQVVKLKAIAVIGGGQDTSPSQVKLFTNNEQLVDFSLIQEATPLQTIQLVESSSECIEYPTKYTKFQNVQSVSQRILLQVCLCEHPLVDYVLSFQLWSRTYSYSVYRIKRTSNGLSERSR